LVICNEEDTDGPDRLLLLLLGVIVVSFVWRKFEQVQQMCHVDWTEIRLCR